jgi:hypothetical protein
MIEKVLEKLGADGDGKLMFLPRLSVKVDDFSTEAMSTLLEKECQLYLREKGDIAFCTHFFSDGFGVRLTRTSAGDFNYDYDAETSLECYMKAVLEF